MTTNDAAPCPNCRRFERGHFMHPTQMNLSLTRLGTWRTAEVDGIHGETVTFRYPEGWTFTGWHHADLSGEIRVGEVVHVNPRFKVVAYGSTMRSMTFETGADAPPVSAQAAVGFLELATGRSILLMPLDEVLTAEAVAPRDTFAPAS